MVTEVNLEKDQSRATIEVTMMEALRKVIARAALRSRARRHPAVPDPGPR